MSRILAHPRETGQRVDSDVEKGILVGLGGVGVDATASMGAGVPMDEIISNAWDITGESALVGGAVGYLGGRFTKLPIGLLRGAGSFLSLGLRAFIERGHIPTTPGQMAVAIGEATLAIAMGYGSAAATTNVQGRR
jgi:hypothetical protein